MIEITQEQFNEILKKHQKWLNNEDDGKRAILTGVSLTRAHLEGVDLRNAVLRWSDLSAANLRFSNLQNADLTGAILSGVNLYKANLEDADLTNTNLTGAVLRDANLKNASLKYANLHMAFLCGAKDIPFIPSICPDEGSFIGYKKVRKGCIVKLQILSDAQRSSGTERKCRCDKAKVLEIQTKNGKKSKFTEIPSCFDKNFIYKVGEIVKVKNFDKDRWNTCSPGIHFFINRQEAVDYNGW